MSLCCWAKKIMKRSSKPLPKPKTFAEYLTAVSADKRAALERLRKGIRSAAPKTEECISYGVPAFRLNGKFLFAMGTTAKHCAFYLGSTVQAFKDDLEQYDTSNGTIRFQANKPLPAALVRKLVRTRIAENVERREKSRSRRS